MTDRTPDEKPMDGQVEVRDWHPDEQPADAVENLVNFTPDEADAIQFYLETLRDLMGLQGWDIYLGTEASAPSTNASMHPVFGRRCCPVLVNKNWWMYSPAIQRNTLVHELLHVIHNDQTETIRTSRLSIDLWRIFERETELMVDHLAGILDQFMPMPLTPGDVAAMRAQKTGPFKEKA